MMKLSKYNELRKIREALGHSQQKMGELVGVDPESAQSAWQRWEADPKKPSARKALEKAKEVYQSEKQEAWISPMLTSREALEVREDAPRYGVTGMLPAHVEAAYSTLCEVLDGIQASPVDVPRNVFARILGKAAREFALASSPEAAREEVIRDAEIFREILK